ncbi:MAG TPA: nitrate/nitrite transporter [Pirellulales bacterium]|nr:nitrate/nitrite transporter [Pirellulales bacterium]
MHLREFRRAGHWPTLLAAFLYFDVSFMVWVLIGALANSIVPDFRLSAAERGLLVAVPILGGALLRLVLGYMTDRIGARRTALAGMTLTVIPLLLAWLAANSFGALLIVGLMLGVAGASFAAALPLASRWYPPQYQGLAMGIAGAGNSGTALATFFGPRLAEAIGWHAVFGLAIVPLVAVLAFFVLAAKDSPTQPPPQTLTDYAAVARQPDLWWFCLFYAVTFGGFVGLASFLNIFFHDQYGLSKAAAGGFATLCVVAGSFLRPAGGYLADRIGGVHLLTLLYLGVGTLLLGLATSPPLAGGTLLMFAVMGMLGMGNGAVFQLVPQRFCKQIGTVTGLVGAAGGLGGFLLPTLLGSVKQQTGQFAGGFFLFSLTAFATAIALVCVSRAWEGLFIGKGGLAASRVNSPTLSVVD